jgi:hypothetical protein
MPIRPYLDGHKFDNETVRLMGIAFEMAVGSIGATPRPDDPIRAALAHKIVAQAQAGERNPERLCEAALSAPSRSAAGIAGPPSSSSTGGGG